MPHWLADLPIAHRGLHNIEAGRAENSIAAFQAAVEYGYAIECDLQVSATGEPVVFHDPTLIRMTGEEGYVRNKTPEELSTLELLETGDTVRTLSEHLELAAGKVPLVLELKGVEGEDAGFVEGVAEALKGYHGLVAVMSFDHWICAQFKELLPNIPRGLTAEGDEYTHATHKQALESYDLQFVSYDVNALPNQFVEDVRSKGMPVITWTVRNQDQVAQTFSYADQMTFEGFLPDLASTKERHD